MSVEVIGKIIQKNNGTFKLMDAVNVDYDGTSSVKDKIDSHELQLISKVNKEYIDNIVANIVSITPVVYLTYLDLQNTYPNGNEGIYVVKENGNWYWWDGAKWAIGGLYQGGIENIPSNAYDNIYIKDTSNNEVYRLYLSNGLVKSQNTSVSAKVLSSITATKGKTVYNMDEPILVDDIIVTATYTDNTTAIVSEWTSNIDELDTFTEGLRKLIINYTLDNITKSTTIYLSVSLSVSSNSKQYIKILNETGNLINGTSLISSTEKIYNRDVFNIRFKLRLIITKNRNTENTIIGIGNSSYWNTDTIKSIEISPLQIGEFIIDCNLDIAFPQTNTNIGAFLFNIYNSNNLLEGKFVLEQASMALIQSAEVLLSSITASKVNTKYFASDTINTNDITVNAIYTNDATKNVTNYTTNLATLDLASGGLKTLVVSYTENGITRTANIGLYIYKADFTEAQPFITTTSKEFSDSINFGWNLGNNLDSYGAGTTIDNMTFGEDMYLNQETRWGQPVIKPETFDLIKSLGFNTVRIPVSWYFNTYIDSNGNRRVGKFWMARVREVVDWALERGFWVIMNSHHDMKMYKAGVPDTIFQQVLKDVVTVWTDIANKFKHHGEHLILEAFNEIDNLEASWQFGVLAAQQMNEMNQIFVNTVRNTGSNNSERVLIVQTLIGSSAATCLDAFVLPTDTVQERLMVEIHTYPKLFLQDIEPAFKIMEAFSNRVNAPILIGEWGTNNGKTNSTDSRESLFALTNPLLRPIHASNFVARAKSHGIKTIWWDNGTTPTSRYDHALINRFDNTVIFQNIINGLKDGYERNIAYQIPDQYINNITSVDQVDYLTLNKDTGSVSYTYWGHLTTNYLPVMPNSTLSVSVNRTGGASTDQIQITTIVFYNSSNNYLSTIVLPWQTITYNTAVPSGASFVKVCINAPSKNLPRDKFSEYLSTEALTFSVENYSLDIISSIDLTYTNVLTDLLIDKSITAYTIGDSVTLDDITVTACYGDGRQVIVGTWTSNFDTLDFTSIGNKTLIITFADRGITLSKEIVITVSEPAPVSSIAATKTTTNYKFGDTILLNDIVVTATYENNTTKTVTGWLTNINSIDITTAGDKTLNISYTEGGITVNTSIVLTITAVPQTIYQWNGEENLPTEFTLSSSNGIPLVKHLGDDGVYYYSNDDGATYGYGSIGLSNPVLPTAGTTEVTSVIDVLATGATTISYARMLAFAASTKNVMLNMSAGNYSSNGLTNSPTLTVGIHTMKVVIHHATSTYDIYIDNVSYGSALSKWNASDTTTPTCLIGLWHTSKNCAKLKSFTYRHIEN